MEKINNLYSEVKPILTTYIFELKKQWKKFVFFSALSLLFIFLLSYLMYTLIPDNPLPATQAEYFQEGLQFFELIIIFATCFFFGGIICYEFNYKTGHIIFPIINRYKIIAGKFLACFTLVCGVALSFYFALGFLGVYFYGGPVNIRFFYSFGIAVLYMLALSCFVTFFSAIMKNVNMTIISCIMLLLIANMIVDQLVVLLIPDFEPVYSINHMGKLISYILEADFPTTLADRYIEETVNPPGGHGMQGDFTMRVWLTPSIVGGITIALSYTLTFLTAALIIYKRKQL
ncbi:MAG: ABC transporter permease [Promethearchaeota archaeon]